MVTAEFCADTGSRAAVCLRHAPVVRTVPKTRSKKWFYVAAPSSIGFPDSQFRLPVREQRWPCVGRERADIDPERWIIRELERIYTDTRATVLSSREQRVPADDQRQDRNNGLCRRPVCRPR